MRSIDLNADVGESFGRWTLGDDEALFPLVSSVNAACGWHGGDPANMRKSVLLAKRYGTALGAHPGLPDLMGFGRRMMEVSHDEVVDMCVYQVGAMMAFAQTEGVHIQHIKPHSKLFVAIMQDESLLLKFADAMLALQPDLIFTAAAGRPAEVMREHGHRTIAELVADMDYADDGSIIIEQRPSWKDPAMVAGRALAMAQDGIVTTTGGKELEIEADTLCIHGDRPNVVDIAQAIRATFDRAEIVIASPTEAALAVEG